MAWDVRPTRDIEEFKRAVGAIGHYFGGWPADDEAAQRFSSNLPFDRMHAAFDGDRIVGGAGAFPFELTVPGGTARCGGVTVVGVLPTHRRRGVLTAMMRAQLEDIRDRGEPLAALWASEEVIYRRFGYGLASLSGEMSLPSGYAALREPPDDRATAPPRPARLVEGRDRRDLRPRPRAHARDVRAHGHLVGDAQPAGSAGPAAGWRREERARARARRRARRLRALSHPHEVRGRRVGRPRRRDRGARRRACWRRASSGGCSSTWTGRRR